MENKLRAIRRVLVKNFGNNDFAFRYYEHRDARNYVNINAFPVEEMPAISKPYKKFKRLFYTNHDLFCFIRLMYIDILILDLKSKTKHNHGKTKN